MTAGTSHRLSGTSSKTKTAPTPLGIDLGTTFSCVAQVDSKGTARTLHNADGDPITPSVVLVEPDGFVVGKEAVKAAVISPELIARNVKRDMGKRMFWKSFGGESYPPEVIQSLILEKLKADAELKVGPVVDAVITVPAYFNEPKRRATQDAGRLAGLNVLDIINEPTAAAIAFGVEQGFLDQEARSKDGETILVYDLGGGTFDVSVLRVEANCFRVIATDGDFQLGGIDFDQKIVSHLTDAFFQQHLIDFGLHASGEQKLLREAEDAKRSLSTRDSVTIRLEHEGNTLNLSLTRKEFNVMTATFVERTRFTTAKVIRDAGLKWSDLTRILLVGGSTRIPAVVQMLESESGMRVDRSLAADEAIAHGAAIYANLLTQRNGKSIDVQITNVNSHDLGVLGIEKLTGLPRTKVLLPRNTALPARHGSAFTTARDDQRSVAVNVVEGGDASGNHSTSIGKCVIRGLPTGLPAGTQVNVIFSYESNGRLNVRASVPSTGQVAKMQIDRASDLSDTKLDHWSKKIRSKRLDRSKKTPMTGSDTPGRISDSAAGHTAIEPDDKFGDIFDLEDFLQ